MSEIVQLYGYNTVIGRLAMIFCDQEIVINNSYSKTSFTKFGDSLNASEYATLMMPKSDTS